MSALGSGRARDHSEANLTGVNPLGANGVAIVLGQRHEAQVAQQVTGIHLVEALAGERCPPALGAVPEARLDRAEASSEEHSCEVGHGDRFANPRKIPPRTQ
jgi:hypothetical protein